MTEKISKCMEVVSKLRNAGINTDIYLENKKIKAKFKYADKLKIPYTIVVGDDEIANNVVTLKNMMTGEQESIKIEAVIEKLI
jgi:histidyl-tRNA synthetase